MTSAIINPAGGAAVNEMWFDPGWDSDETEFILSAMHEGENEYLAGYGDYNDHSNDDDSNCYDTILHYTGSIEIYNKVTHKPPARIPD